MRRVAQRRPPPLPRAGPNPRPRRRTAASTCPIPGDGSDIMFHLRSRPPWKMLHGSHWTIGNQTAPAYWPTQRYQHRDAGRYYTFGQCASTLAECAELHSRRTPNVESRCRGRTHQNVPNDALMKVVKDLRPVRALRTRSVCDSNTRQTSSLVRTTSAGRSSSRSKTSCAKTTASTRRRS